MKITRTSREYRDKQRLKIEALEGCNVCPCCGETKSYLQYIKNGIQNKGIVNHRTCKHWYGRKDKYDSFSLSKFIPCHYDNWQIECFSCKTCGAEWESEPYIV